MTVRKTKPKISRTSSFSGCMKICVAGIMFSMFYAISELRESAFLSVVKLEESQPLDNRFSMRSLMSDNESECREVKNTNHSQQCDFIKNTDDCQIEEDDGFINYNEFVYCVFDSSLKPLALIILFFWWIFLFTGLAVAADDYFCPSLIVISKTLHLSDNMAGVTFLTFGNAAPDLFSAIAAVGNAKNGDTGLAFGGLLGAGIFTTTVMAGTIAIICPFDAMQRPFLRDVIFYIAATIWTFTVLWNKEIGKLEAIGFILMYLFYVLVVVIGEYWYQRNNKIQVLAEINVLPEDKEKDEDDSYPNSVEISTVPEDKEKDEDDSYPNSVKISTVPEDKEKDEDDSYPNSVEISTVPEDKEKDEDDSYPNSVEISTVPEDKEKDEDDSYPNSVEISTVPEDKEKDEDDSYPNSVKIITVPEDKEKDEDDSYPNSVEISTERRSLLKPPKEESADTEPETPLEEFFSAINPIDTDGWSDMRWYAKCYEIFKSPLVFVLTITIPVMDYDKKKNNWNRYLNSLQIFLGITFSTFATKVGLEKIGSSFHVWILLIIIGAVLSLVVFLTSKNEVQPVYHKALSYLGFVVVVVWMYIIANENVNILQAFGIVFNISNAILGLTLLAWGNSIGDFIANMVMARQGFPRMGMSACFGEPLFNLLLGVGIPFTIGTIKNGGTYKINVTIQEVILVSFLMLSLVTSLVVVPLLKFRMSKPYGLILIVVYIVFLIVAILGETGVITGNIDL